MKNEAVDIVLIEDNPNDAELTMDALQRENLGSHIMLLMDGEEALDYLFSRGKYKNNKYLESVKLILLDLKLPKISGLEVLKMVKSNERTKSIPVVVLTSSAEDYDVIESYKLGANSYIVKPVDFEQFLKTVKEIGLYWLILNQAPYN